MAKRNTRGRIISHQHPNLSSGLECIPLSPIQLRELWDYDNQCANQIMNIPVRTCSCKESVEGHSSAGISSPEFEQLKKTIKDIWNRAKTLFEVFYDPKEPTKGYRLRVNDCMPIKITLRDEDSFFFGWCAVAPSNSPCSHLYNRSPVTPSGYLGGPASFCNWADGKQATSSMARPTSQATRYLVRLECKNLTRGQELTWNYGYNKKMPVEADWFKEQCCKVFEPTKGTGTKRHEKKNSMLPLINVEKCVLCGEPYSINNKECRVQRKSHLINSHANFLGSSWDGVGPYLQEEVDSVRVLKEADMLNSLLQTLTKELKWNVIPACNVISITERDNFSDPQTLLTEFRKRCALFKSIGTVVLRGLQAGPVIENLSAEHLKPIPISVWRTLNWKDKVQPHPGQYAVPSQNSEEHSNEVQSYVLKFCTQYFLS